MATTKKKTIDIIEDDDLKRGPKGSPIIVPEGLTLRRVIDVLQRKMEDAETWTVFHHNFYVRPWDGANATDEVIKAEYGVAFNKGQDGFFGPTPPPRITIKVGVNKQKSVPWGEMVVPVLGDATVVFDSTHDDDYGQIFHISVEARKKYKLEIEKLFANIEEYLKEHSIYKGKAIVGYESPDFLDLREFKASEVVYSDDVFDMLASSLWGPMEMRERYAEDGISRKRSVLLFGPFGTGKTLAGQLTAEIAEKNGWTFIAARPGKDKLEDVLRTARIYMPAVVFFEDVDSNANSDGGNDTMTQILDAFDGITNKGGELMCVMTTNHVERIQKGMLRPGRLDAVIEIAELDRGGIEKLIKSAVKSDSLADGIDFDEVYASMHGFFPAFVKECVTRALSVALYRNKGAKDYTINGQDLITAAHSLRPQLELMNGAREKTDRPALDTVLRSMVSDVSTEVQNDTILKSKNGHHVLVVGEKS